MDCDSGGSRKRYGGSTDLKMLVAVLIAAAVVLGTFYAIYVRGYYKNEQERRAIARSMSAVSFIQADKIKHDAAVDETYIFIEEALARFKNSNSGIEYAGLLVKTGEGGFRLIADTGTPAQSEEYGGYLLSAAIDTRPDIIHIKDRMITLVPVVAPDTDETIAVLAAVYPHSYWYAEADSHSLNTVLSTIIATLLLSIFYWLTAKNDKMRELSDKIKSSESLFRTVFEQSPIGIAISHDYKFVANINPALEKIFGRSKDDIASSSWIDLTYPEDLQEDLELFAKFKSGEIPGYSMRKRFIRPDGSYVWTKMIIAPLQLEGEDYNNHHLCLVEDITQKIKTENALHESERSKAVMLSHLPGMAYRCRHDLEWTMLFVSDGCMELTGYRPEELLFNKSLSYNDLIAPEYRSIIWNEWERVLVLRVQFKYEYEILTRKGERKWVLEMGQGVYNEAGALEALEGIVIDVSDQKMREAQIQHMGNHDLLTGLYNRKFFEEIKPLMDAENNLPISAIIADINDLRLINNAFGHVEGDNIIIETAYIIKSCCRDCDVISRTGGDEFSILLPKTDKTQTGELIRKLNAAFDKYNASLKSHTYDISLSIGSCTKEHPNESLEQTLRTSEDMMLNRKLLNRKKSHNSLLSSIMATMYERSRETEEHAERLAGISRMIGEKLDLPQKSMDELELLAMLHDLGKVGIDDRILKKTDKLTEDEWAIMKKHPEIGSRIAMSSYELEHIAEYILSHHERWDGNGYPQGLAGRDIPLLSRIIAVADSFDAMTEDRVYRKAMSKKDAMEEIRKNAGTQFDPEIAAIFLRNI